MRKNLSKIMCIGVVLIMVLGILCACNDNRYNDVLYDSVGEYINQQYMQEHLTFRESGFPADEYFIINTQEEFEQIFIGFPTEVDFERQMVLLKVRGFCTSAHKYSRVSIKIENKKLICKYDIDCPENADSASSPFIRYVALVLDKCDIESFDFVFKR